MRKIGLTGFALAVGLALAPWHAAGAQTLETLHVFCQTACAKGQLPRSKLLVDAAGNLFGTTAYGGHNNGGTLFEMVKQAGGGWKFARLESFCVIGGCSRGMHPYAGVIADVDGNLYGTALEGGSNGGGTVYEWRPDPPTGEEHLKILHAFCGEAACADGKAPMGALTYAGEASGVRYDGTSPLYGTTYQGGADNLGVAFRIVPDGGGWTETVIHDFGAPGDGATSMSGLTMDAAGNLYGTTFVGGAGNAGTVYELSPAGPSWTETLLHSFCRRHIHCHDGTGPDFGVIFDGEGNLYGSTNFGGEHLRHRGGAGVVYKLTPNGSGGWDQTVLHSMCSLDHCADGRFSAYLALDANGDLIGLTANGGRGYRRTGGGVMFKLHGAEQTILYSFGADNDPSQGIYPFAPVTIQPDGSYLGTTYCGGAAGARNCITGSGTVFKFTPAALP